MHGKSGYGYSFSKDYLPTDKRLAPPPPTSDPDDLPYSPEDNEPYSPPDGIADSDDYLTSIQVKTEEPYTPSSVADGGGYKTAMDMVTTQTATNATGDQSHPEKMSDSSGGFTEKLAKLQAEGAAKKAELAMREASLGMNVAHKPAMPLSSRPNQQFSSAFSTDGMEKNKSGIDLAALPQPITNILFGGGPPGPLNKTPLPPKLPMPPLPMQMPMGGHQMGASFTQPQQSSLNRMSDAELIAKAEAMDMPGHGRGPLPPPGPGMPGKLQGQGIGNIALMEQMEMEGQREEDMRNMASYQMGDQGRFQEGGWDNERWEVERGGYENSRGQQQGVWDKPRQFDMERGRGGRGDWGGRRDERRDWAPGPGMDRRDSNRDWERRDVSGPDRRDNRRDFDNRRDRDWEDDESNNSNRRMNNPSREGSPTLDTIPLKIPAKVDVAKHDMKGEKSKGVVDVHADVAAQLANIDAEFKLPGCSPVDLGSPVSEGSPGQEKNK